MSLEQKSWLRLALAHFAVVVRDCAAMGMHRRLWGGPGEPSDDDRTTYLDACFYAAGSHWSSNMLN